MSVGCKIQGHAIAHQIGVAFIAFLVETGSDGFFFPASGDPVIGHQVEAVDPGRVGGDDAVAFFVGIDERLQGIPFLQVQCLTPADGAAGRMQWQVCQHVSFVDYHTVDENHLLDRLQHLVEFAALP